MGGVFYTHTNGVFTIGCTHIKTTAQSHDDDRLEVGGCDVGIVIWWFAASHKGQTRLYN